MSLMQSLSVRREWRDGLKAHMDAQREAHKDSPGIARPQQQQQEGSPGAPTVRT